MWAALGSWLFARPWAIAGLALAVVVGGLYGQNVFYGWRIDQLKAQRDQAQALVTQYKSAADQALASARAQNAALVARLQEQEARVKASERTRARLEQGRVQLEAELALLLDRPKPKAEDLCAASCLLLRSPL